MIEVIDPGFYTTIQDFGRIGYRKFGVPYSGVMDRKASALVNSLLGNNIDEAVIEMTMTGAELKFKIATSIAISGADMSAKLNNKSIKLNKRILVNPNDILSFGKLKSGFRCYLGVFGGFNTEIVMNSKSQYKNITKQLRLVKNDKLQIIKHSTIENQNSNLKFNTSYIDSEYLDVFKGPEFNKLSRSQHEQLFSKTFTVSNTNNRMAYQLNEVLVNNLKPIITSPVLPGTVQLTPSGKLIILMRDCQTTGGYPRVLQLKVSAINVLSQKFSSNSIKFKLVE